MRMCDVLVCVISEGCESVFIHLHFLWTPTSPHLLFMPEARMGIGRFISPTKLEYRISAFKCTFATKFAEICPKLHNVKILRG